MLVVLPAVAYALMYTGIEDVGIFEVMFSVMLLSIWKTAPDDEFLYILNLRSFVSTACAITEPVCAPALITFFPQLEIS